MNKIYLYILLLLSILCFSQRSKTIIYWVNQNHGLNQLNVKYCIPDTNGFMWIGTQLGLYRFDGVNVEQINDKNMPELANERVKCMSKNFENNDIYYSTFPSNSIFLIRNNKIRRIQSDEGVFLNNITFLQFKNKFFSSFFSENKMLIDSDRFTLKFINSLYTNNTLFFNNNKFIFLKRKTGKILKINFENNAFSKFILLDNKLIVLRKTTGLIENKGALQKIALDQILNEFVHSNELNKEKSILYYDDIVLLNFKNNIYKLHLKNNKLSSEFLFTSPAIDITNFSYSKKNNLFILCTASNGIALVKQKKIKTIFFNNDFDINYTVVNNNRKWYGYKGWVYDSFTNQIKINSINDQYGNYRFLLEYNDDVFYQSKVGFTSLINPKKKKKLELSGVFDFTTSFTFFNNKLWISSEKKLGVIVNDHLMLDLSINKYIHSTRCINSICGFKDHIILATTIGVIIHYPFLKKDFFIKGLEKVCARYIKPIDKNSFWVGCYGDGLFLVKNNKAYKVVDKNIELNTAHAIEEDEKGDLWISTNNGLLTINKSTIVTNTLSHQPVECYRFSTEDGLLSNEFNGGSTHPSLHTKEGILGFPSMKGFVWFQPKEVKKQLFSGSILMDKVEVNNKTEITLKNSQYSIPKEAEVLIFNFSYGYYFNRENLTVAYRFDDQPNWISIKGNSFQIGRYKKGTHNLLIRITTHGFEDKQGVTKAFLLDFEARYYEQTWFWTLISVLFSLLLLSAYRLGLKLNRKRQEVLKQKIEDKTLELRSSITELEYSKEIISNSLQEKNILLKEVHHRVKNNLQLIISMLNIQARRKNYHNIEAFLQKANRRISSMALIHQRLYQSEEELDKINFKLYVEDLVNSINQTFHNEGDNIMIQVNTNQVLLNLNTAVPLGLIINELVTNALKHAFPENKKGIISITIRNRETNQFELIVEDNGIGFKINTTQTKSFGLELINLLASQLNGTVKIENISSTKFSITFQEIDL